MTSVGDVIALIDTTFKILESANNVRQASEDWKALEKEIANSRIVLKSLHQQLQSPRFQEKALQQIVQPLLEDDGPLQLIKSVSNKIQAEIKITQSKRKQFFKAVKWPSKTAKIRDLRSQIEGAKTDIQLTLNQA